jgi:hypothetical protein
MIASASVEEPSKPAAKEAKVFLEGDDRIADDRAT